MKRFFVSVGVLVLILLGYSFWGGLQMHKEEQALNTISQKQMNEQNQTNLDGSYVVDVAASKVVWTGKKKIIKEWVDKGTLAVKSGKVTILNSESSFEGTLGDIVFDMNTIASKKIGTKEEGEGSPKLDTHLKSADFFDVVKFPESSFKLNKVTRNEKGLILEGDLTIKGVTKPVTLASITNLSFVDGTTEYIEVDGRVTFNRTDFGVRFGSDSFFDNLGDNVIEDEILLDLTLVAKKVTNE